MESEIQVHEGVTKMKSGQCPTVIVNFAKLLPLAMALQKLKIHVLRYNMTN